jgi:cytochrome c-type biogenesis protein CcsB
VTNQSWETLSNQAVAAAGIVYFLSLLSYLVHWASLRKVPVGRKATVSVGVGGLQGSGADTSPVAGDGSTTTNARRVEMTGRLGLILLGLACALHFVALLGRGMAADPNRVPWGNMYEFTLSGTFVVALIFVVARRRLGLDWAGPIVAAVVVTLLMVGVIWLYEPVAPLTEALNSYWLVIHVVSAVISTGGFTLGGLCSILYLVKERKGPTTSGYLSRVPEPAVLDRTAYRLHAFAFPVWTFAVLIAGPIWAHQAWSSYWNWDPKEVWAFITWVVYAAYLHARATAGWRGRNAAYLALLGMATLWFNFIGINYFSTTSQHSYASGAPALTSAAPAHR